MIDNEINILRQVARNVYEVWAGSEAIPTPETALEKYLLRLVEQMRDEAKKGLSVESVEDEGCATSASDYQAVGAHYIEMAIDPWAVIDTWPIEQRIGYYRGNLLKYTMRMGSKDAQEQEIAKAEHYAAKLREVLQGDGT